MRSRYLVTAVLAALSLTVGACSDSSGGSSDDAGALEVGAICSCTGPFGAINAALSTVADAWAKSVNDAGGIDGHPVELTMEDDGGDPGNGVTIVQKFVTDGVDVILDLTPLDSAWAELASDADIPVVGGQLSSKLYYTDPNFYPSGQTNDTATQAVVATAKQAGATRLGQLYCAEAPSCQEIVPLLEQAGEEQGLPVSYSASIAATAPNYTAECLAARDAGIDALFIANVPPIVARVATDCERQGYHPIYVQLGTGYKSELASTPGTEDNLWSPFPILPFFADDPAVQRYRDALDKYAPDLTDSEGYSQGAPQGWTGGLLIERAVESAGLDSGDAVSADDVRAGLDSLQNETLDGWSPGLTFTAGEPHSVGCWFTVHVQDGQPALTNEGDTTCLDDVGVG